MKVYNILIILILLSPLPVFAGAWTQPRGGYYAQFSFWRFTSTSIFDRNGNKRALADAGKFEEKSFYAYFESGVSDAVTFVASIPYKNLRYTSQTLRATSQGVSDVYVGLRYLLGRHGFATSLQTGLKLALNDATGGDELKGAPPLSDGQTDFELRVLIGRSLVRSTAYMNLDVGYRARSGAPVDEIPYALELGVHVGKRALLILQGYGTYGLSSVEGPSFRESQISLSPEENFTKFQAQLVVRMGAHVALAVIGEQTVAGKNTSAGKVLAIGLVLSK